ncbi:hypothetical protein GFS24_26730 [Chitinophaga sp. SYP-B3965]|uniref:clostripain-related cysteine peptidase n=1 Tax=Chitinophaga sp. SYP-B3965 TaxID=2663120 RepID=UPI00129972A6|nr:clostripain-related cysteine peptidase [Chitinophaga sp. SYP-B3965]MRG48736.1 hypothetical protein [Chitinophaga sp. SYP-B3965]
MEKIQNTIIHLATVSVDWAFAKNMLEEIASQLITADNRVILCLETSQEILRLLGLPAQPLSAGADPKEAFTIVYQLIPDGGQSKWEPIPFPLPDFNMRFHWHLTTFFREYIIAHNPAERYFLFLWGHGSSYSLFPNIAAERSEAGPSTGHLGADHLSRAIIDASTFSSPFKISVLLMINCYMQTIETGYELSIAQTDYLVAPENIGSFEGYDYKELFRILFTNPAVTSEDFARTAITTLSSYNSPIRDIVNSLSRSAFSAIHLQNYGVLFRLMDELAAQLLIIPATDIAGFLRIRIAASFAPGTVDLGNFLFLLQREFKELHTIINEIFVLLSSKTLVIECFIGKEVTIPVPFSYHGIAVGFLSIAIARSLGVPPVYVRHMHRASPFASTFTKTNTWGQFAEKYFPTA